MHEEADAHPLQLTRLRLALRRAAELLRWAQRDKSWGGEYAKAMDRIKPEGDDGKTCHRWNTHYR